MLSHKFTFYKLHTYGCIASLSITIFILHTIFTANYGLEKLLSIMSALLHHKLPPEVIGGFRDWVIMLIRGCFLLGWVFDHCFTGKRVVLASVLPSTSQHKHTEYTHPAFWWVLIAFERFMHTNGLSLYHHCVDMEFVAWIALFISKISFFFLL